VRLQRPASEADESSGAAAPFVGGGHGAPAREISSESAVVDAILGGGAGDGDDGDAAAAAAADDDDDADGGGGGDEGEAAAVQSILGDMSDDELDDPALPDEAGAAAASDQGAREKALAVDAQKQRVARMGQRQLEHNNAADDVGSDEADGAGSQVAEAEQKGV
jgi:hypothetical protein